MTLLVSRCPNDRFVLEALIHCPAICITMDMEMEMEMVKESLAYRNVIAKWNLDQRSALELLFGVTNEIYCSSCWFKQTKPW